MSDQTQEVSPIELLKTQTKAIVELGVRVKDLEINVIRNGTIIKIQSRILKHLVIQTTDSEDVREMGDLLKPELSQIVAEANTALTSLGLKAEEKDKVVKHLQAVGTMVIKEALNQ